MTSKEDRSWLLYLVACERNWDAADHLSADELAGKVREWPAFGSTEHRLLSTILLLQTELEALKAL